MRSKFIVLVILFISGCAGGSLDRNYSRSSLTDDELLQRILRSMVIPTSYRVYADERRVNKYEEIGLEDVVYYNSSCIIYELRRNATRMDLEVINALWVKRDESAKEAIINSWGRQAYLSGVETYSNADFDCGIVVSRWLNAMDS